MLAEVAVVIAIELENAAIFGLTGEPVVVTVPPPPLPQANPLPVITPEVEERQPSPVPKATSSIIEGLPNVVVLLP
jgi:hypothetical protein